MKKYTLLILFFLLLMITEFSGAISSEIITLEEIEPGMKGESLTVFEGVEVESFTVTVKDILKDDMDNDLILIESGDEKIEEIGGIAAGMSGSPVYFEDRLAGAIAYSWNNIDDNYAMVTPVARMKKLFEETSINKQDNISQNVQDRDLSQVYSPLLVSGIQGRALERLKKDLTNFDIRKTSAGQAEMEIDKQTLEPGSAIAVQLVRGDINVSSVGTLTFMEDNQIAAFGHSFTNSGPVNYLFSKAYINTIVSSSEYPFKVGHPLDILQGSINVDRRAGIAGRTDRYPQIIPLRMNIKDKDRNVSESVFVQIVNDENFLVSLGTTTALQAIDNTIDRIGKGTANFELEVIGRQIPDHKITRNNMYYSRQDIAARTLVEFQEILDIIAHNPFQQVNIHGLNLDIEIASEDKQALIQEAEIINEELTPGETIKLQLTLLPYRSQPVEEMVEIEIPDNFRPGNTNIHIVSGSTYINSTPVEPVEDEEDMTSARFAGYTELEPLLSDFLETPKNNEIIIEGFAERERPEYVPEEIPEEEIANIEDELPDEEPPEEKQQSDNNEIEENEENEEKVTEFKKIKNTDYVIEGNLDLRVEIEESNEQEE